MEKVRHLDCTDLWVQEVVRSGRVELLKIPGAENPADVLTKYVEKLQNVDLYYPTSTWPEFVTRSHSSVG